jgi:hypothetical protein
MDPTPSPDEAGTANEITGHHDLGCRCWPHVSVSTNSPIALLAEEWSMAADQATSVPSAAAYRMCADMLRAAIERNRHDR